MADLAGWYVIEYGACGLGDLCTLTPVPTDNEIQNDFNHTELYKNRIKTTPEITIIYLFADITMTCGSCGCCHSYRRTLIKSPVQT